MDDILLIIAGVVVLVLIVLLITGKIKWQMLLIILAGIAAVFGVSAFRNQRKSKILEEAQKKEDELKKKEADLKDQQEKARITKEEMDKQLQALDEQRASYAKKMLEIDAEEKQDVKQAKEKVNTMSAAELKAEFLKRIGE